MTHCDYAVVTWSGVDAERLLPFLYFVAGVDGESESCVLYGARARRGKNANVGQWENGTVLLVATGAVAHEVALAVRTVAVESRSVARLDLQVTLPYAGADEHIISLRPAGRYKSVRYQSLSGRGVTLYVGAPASAARLRVYNKTAESGETAPDGSELVRYELQTRDKYADAAYRALVSGAAYEYLMHWMRKMLASPEVLNILSGRIAAGDCVVLPPDREDEGWVERRKRWFETCVIPALRKLIAVEPGYLHVVQSLIDSPQDVVVRAGNETKNE